MNYDTQFINNPIETAQLYSFALGAGPAGFKSLVDPDPHDDLLGYSYVNRLANGTVGPIHGHPLGGLRVFDWGNAAPLGGVKLVSFNLWENTPPVVSNTVRRHSLELSFDPAVGGFNAYYLPWDETGGALYMTLGGAADYFFTAGLSGCSIMISGNPTAPTVYHCGIGGWPTSAYCAMGAGYNNPDPTGPTSTEIWEDLVAHITNTTQLFPGINTTDYLNDRTPGALQTTMRSRQMETALKKKKNDNTAQANPFGAVFGLRDNNGNWSFYLQENVTMKYQKGLWPNEYDAFKCRPLQVDKFFPWQKTYARLWTKF